MLFFFNSGFTLHTISINSPSNFICTNLSLGSDACRYSPGTSKVCIALPSWASINNDANSASSAMLGGVASSRDIYVCWENFFLHVLYLILPHFSL